MRPVLVTIAVACAGAFQAIALATDVAERDACLTAEQQQELYRRTNAASLSLLVGAATEYSARSNEASAAHSRALAAVRRCESTTGDRAGDKCGEERAAAEKAAKDYEEIANLKRKRMNEAKAGVPEAIRSIRAEYPNCEHAR